MVFKTCNKHAKRNTVQCKVTGSLYTVTARYRTGQAISRSRVSWRGFNSDIKNGTVFLLFSCFFMCGFIVNWAH